MRKVSLDLEKIFILGIGGLTGSKLAIVAQNDFEVFGSYNLRDPKLDFSHNFRIDITQTKKLDEILLHERPRIIVNACALNSVDYCETHQGEATKINMDAVQELCRIANQLGAKFVHMSTDSVFDGTKSLPYKEDDIPNPINFYGYTKVEGERITMEHNNNLVVRASVIYGWPLKTVINLPSSSMKPTNFAQWLINKLRSNENVKIITDEYSSPIIADDFAKSILHLIKNDCSGIFHLAPQIRINRFDFSRQLVEYLGLDSRLIQPVTNKELGRQVTTGFNKCLDSSKIINLTKFKFLSLQESFKLLHEQVYNI